MPIRTYHDFILAAADVSQDKHGLRGFTVRVVDSTLGKTEPEPRAVPDGFAQRLGQLDRRKLHADDILKIGETLGELLLGGKVGNLLNRCLSETLKPEEGLRLRLKLPTELAGFPWEYVYRQRGGGEKDATGFLALDPRISFSRQETLAPKSSLDAAPRARRMLVAMASPVDEDELDLAQERENLHKAFQNSTTNIELDFLEDATVEGLGRELREQVDILHFAGHGRFKDVAQGKIFGTTTGEGAVLLVNEQGKSASMPADQLAVNLKGSNVQLVVLGACETGKRDAENVWSGVVTAVVEAEVPAAVAMQFSVWDDAAITFARNFYQVLAAGFPLDYAVSEARRAIFNLCNPQRDHVDRGRYWRDWGVPVLYQQTAGNFTLAAQTQRNQRRAIELYYLGRDAYYERRYSLALDYLYQATEADPDLTDAYEMICHIQQSLAMGDIQQGNYDVAELKLIKANEAAKQTDPLDAWALAGRGFVFKSFAQVAEGRGVRERKEGESAEKQQGVKEARQYYARAERFFKEAGGHYAEAERHFQQALRLDPDDAAAQLGMGNVLYAQNKLDEAFAACSRATELMPKFTSAHHDLALVCERKMTADPEHADDWCRAALAAWRRTRDLMQGDAAYPPDYVSRYIEPRLAWFTQQCGPGEPVSGGETGS
jgi:tetratricopeptide (TPR) repeat protein